MTFETPDDVLEHFGVKGMKWGVRKQKPKLTAAQRRARTERRQKNVGRVLTTVALAAYAASLLGAVGSTRVGDIPPSYGYSGSSGSSSRRSTGRSVTDLINQERDTQLSSLRRTHREGHLDADQLRIFEEKLNRRYDRRVAEAGGG